MRDTATESKYQASGNEEPGETDDIESDSDEGSNYFAEAGFMRLYDQDMFEKEF